MSGVTIGDSGGSGIALERRNVVTVSQSVIEGSGNHGIQLSGGPPPSRNTLTLNGVRVLGTFNHGVSSGANNSLTIRDSEFSDTGLRGVSVNINSDLTLTNTSFSNIGSFAVRIGPNSRILVANNTFRDTIGLHAFNFVGTGTVVSVGSDGNVDATSGASLCNVVVVPNAFSGSLTFVNGVVLTSNTPPCN